MPRPATRRQKARALVVRAMNGPASLTDNQAKSYRLWASTWLLPEIEALIPEARGSGYRSCTSDVQQPKWGEVE